MTCIRIRRCATILAFLLVATGCQPQQPEEAAPQQIFVGTFVTLGEGPAEVEALAVTDGVIVAAGDAMQILTMADAQTEIIDIPGVAVPGWIDSHVHVTGLGSSLLNLNVQGMTIDQVHAAVGEIARATPAGDWIVGRGWDEGFFDVPQYPEAADLDSASPDNPVILSRIGGHSAWVNSAALTAARIDQETQDPPGGHVVRDSNGDATGMMLEQATDLITAAMPDMDTAEYAERYIRAALDQYRKWGLTGVHDAGSSLQEINIFKKLLNAGELPLRIYAMAKGDEAVNFYLANGPEIGLGEDRLTVRSVKIMVDGALGARGAEMSTPYSDAPETSGLQQMNDDEIDTIFRAARSKGLQVNGHVIGDLAVERLLDAIERNDVAEDERFRLEHASIISPRNLPRFAQLGVIASMQPVFIGEYQRWGVDRVGEKRAPWIMPIHDLIATGARLAVSTDYPASDSGDPRTTLNGLVNRTGFDGEPKGGWFPEQAVDLNTALRAMSAGSAYAAFQEDKLGALTVGRYADFTVLGEDPRTVAADKLLSLDVLMTVVGGNVTFQQEE